MHIGSTGSEVSKQLAEYVLEVSSQHKGPFHVCVSGGKKHNCINLASGSLPALLGKNLKEEPYKSKVDWENWHVWFVDERYVALDHAESNYK